MLIRQRPWYNTPAFFQSIHLSGAGPDAAVPSRPRQRLAGGRVPASAPPAQELHVLKINKGEKKV